MLAALPRGQGLYNFPFVFSKHANINSSRVFPYFSFLCTFHSSGLLPYYFHKLTDPTRAKEVDRCVYNNMFDNPECKNASIPMIKNVHFTVCQKPWTCTTHAKNAACTPFMEKWFQLRREVRFGS